MRPSGLFNSRSTARRRRAARLRRSVRRRCLCFGVTTLIAGCLIWYHVSPLVKSYGFELFYYMFAPGWMRWLNEPAPRIVIPREGFGTKPGRLPPGVERWGDYLISRLSVSPNVTLVHDFMTREECAFLRNLTEKIGLVSGTRFSVSNAALSSYNAALFNYLYSLVRTSNGQFVDYKTIDPDDREKVLAIARKAEAITGLEVGNSERPFLQHYKPSKRFRAHYDMYDVDMTRPFPYTANPRSVTLLVYLNDVKIGGGGETEFMMALPRPLRILPREGAALVWANCELENAEVVDTRRGEAWDEGKCMGGGGRHGGTAYSPEPMPGEHTQWPCCVAREIRSLHQSRPVDRGHGKWTMTMWMHQRFTAGSTILADLLGYPTTIGAGELT